MEESIIVALVTVIFLLHASSALVAIVTLPVGILMAFLAMRVLGLSANIMSLGGIAIAIGAMIDAAIVMVENLHKHIERNEREATPLTHWQLVVSSAQEVGPALFISLLIIAFSFLPVFALEAQEGRLFKPLAWTKTLSMAAASLLSITLVPLMMGLFIRKGVKPEARNPVNRALIRVYRPMIGFVLRHSAASQRREHHGHALAVSGGGNRAGEADPPAARRCSSFTSRGTVVIVTLRVRGV